MPKGEAIAHMEQLAEAAVERIQRQRDKLNEAFGDVQYGAEKTSLEERARKYLPGYYHIGKGQGALAVQYWNDMIEQHGPKETLAFARDMEKLLNNPKYYALAVTAAPADIADKGRWMRQEGLHPAPPPGSIATPPLNDPASGPPNPVANPVMAAPSVAPVPSMPAVPNIPPLGGQNGSG